MQATSVARQHTSTAAQPAAREHRFKAPKELLQPQTFAADVAVRFAGDELAMLFAGREIGPAGLFLESDLLFESGEELDVSFSMPEGQVINAVARVTEVAHDDQPGGMQLEFVTIAKSDWGTLYEFARG